MCFGLRFLLESSCDSFSFDALLFLDTFCDEIVTIYGGNERIDTLIVHCLLQFVNQVRRFGPLYFYPAMSFEAANRVLAKFFRSTLRIWKYLSMSFDETTTNKHWDAGSASKASHFKNKFRFRQQQWCFYVSWVCGDECSKNGKNVLSRSRVL